MRPGRVLGGALRMHLSCVMQELSRLATALMAITLRGFHLLTPFRPLLSWASQGRRFGLTASLVAGLSPIPVWAANFDVNSDASLRSAITSAASGDTITFTSNITLAADLPAVQTSVTIIGNNNTLSGNNQFRGLFIGAFSG